MKYFKLELTSYEDRFQLWFISEAMLEVFRKLGDSYSVLWETPEGEKRLTPQRDRGNLERYILSKGVKLSEEDPNKLIFGEF